jgi:hypothetical protein
MNLSGEMASVLLTDDGNAILEMVQIGSSGSSSSGLNNVEVNIAESDDLGLWIRVRRQDRQRLLLLRWDYILSLEVRERSSSTFQMKGIPEA